MEEKINEYQSIDGNTYPTLEEAQKSDEAYKKAKEEYIKREAEFINTLNGKANGYQSIDGNIYHTFEEARQADETYDAIMNKETGRTR